MQIVSGSWDRRIRRAKQLAADEGPATALLQFYMRLLQQQKAVYTLFNVTPPSGSIEADAKLIAESGSALLQEVAEHGPTELSAEASALLEHRESIHEQLLTYWRDRSDRQFFAKAMLQPYGQWLADSGVKFADDLPARTDNRCPHCGGVPQLAVLEAGAATSADGSGRQLLCATCLAQWPFRRVACPYCGEEDERKLGYFQSPAFAHIRLDPCEGCRRYLKTIDLGRLGLAVPLVDEVAGAPLDLWAQEHGYQKIELNLVGL